MDFNRRDVMAVALASALAPRDAFATETASTDLGAVPSWYAREPIRVAWNILRDIDGGTSGAKLVNDAADAGANMICVTVGGSRAFYPTNVPFHERSSALAPGRDLVGEVTEAARARNVRIIARFDFSKQPAETAEAHPEWFYKNADGSLSSSQGRYRPCINTGFYREHAPAVVMEVVERYRPSMIFLNNFSNYILQTGDSQTCHCDACKAAWAQAHGEEPLPETMTPAYMAFQTAQSAISAGAIEFPARRAYPDIVIINADYKPTDGIHLESRMARPDLQMWPYSTSEATARQFTSNPGKVGLMLCISYSHNKSRLAVMPPAETRLRMIQAIASGSHPAYAMTGTFDQYDRTALGAAKEIFAWHKANEDLYLGQQNAARVLLIGAAGATFRHKEPKAEASERGLYQILAENHVPVTSTDIAAPMLERSDQFDLVIVSRGAPLNGVERFVRNGGRAIFVDQHPGFAIPPATESLRLDGTAYWRVRDASKLTGFPSVDFIMAGGSPVDLQDVTLQLYPPERNAALTFVPPMFEDPAEQAASNLQDTQTPGILWRNVGRGRIAFLPWDLGGLYNRIYMPNHANLFMAVVNDMLPRGRQIETDAAASVQMILMDQPEQQRKLLHLINLSGQTQRGYADPTPTAPIRIALNSLHRQVHSRALGRALTASQERGRTIVELPKLSAFDVLVFA